MHHLIEMFMVLCVCARFSCNCNSLSILVRVDIPEPINTGLMWIVRVPRCSYLTLLIRIRLVVIDELCGHSCIIIGAFLIDSMRNVAALRVWLKRKL